MLCAQRCTALTLCPTPDSKPMRPFGITPPQAAAVDMEEEFLSLGLDIIGLGVFNYDFGSITRESPVIKARRRGPGCGRARAGVPRNNRQLHWGGLLSAGAVEHLTLHPYAAANRHDAGQSSAACR